MHVFTTLLRPNKQSYFKIILLFALFICSKQSLAQAPAITYQTPQTYTVNTPITPLAPTNTGGAIVGSAFGQVTTFASGGFNTVTGVAVDAAGNVYVDDWANNLIKKVTPAGVISVFAGSGANGSTDGQGTAASFSEPDGIVIDASGNIYVSDQETNLIRKITPAGFVTTFAGSGAIGAVNANGNAASFYSPRGLAVDPAGNIYVADQANNMIRKITISGDVTTVAGSLTAGFTNATGTAATFNTPTGVGIDAAGNLYVADAGNNAIRKITPAGVVTTVAMGFNFPREVRVDASGNLYVTEQNGNKVKKVTPAGVVTTLAGTGAAGATNGDGSVATFNGPLGLALDGNGNLYVGDNSNNSVRKIVISNYTIDKTLPAGLLFDPTTGIISGTPTVTSPVVVYTVTAHNGSGSSSTTVTIAVTGALLPSIITMPGFNNAHPDANGNFPPGGTSTNNQTTITYTSSNPAVATITPDGLLHIVGPGTSNITASQPGNAMYSPATPVTTLLTVVFTSHITFPTITTKSLCSTDFSVNATSDNTTIPLTYASSNVAVATISATGLVHIVGPGTTTFTISQAGNNLYIAATPVTQTLTIVQTPTPYVNITPTNIDCVTGLATYGLVGLKNAGSNPTYQWVINGVATGGTGTTYTPNPVLGSRDFLQCIVSNTDDPVCAPTTYTSNVASYIAPNATPSVTIQQITTGVICSGSPVNFTATPANSGANITYQWQVNGVNSGANSAQFSSSNLKNGDQVVCNLTSNDACHTHVPIASNSITTTIGDATPITVSITASANYVDIGTPITFKAVSTGTVKSYQWQVNGTNAGTGGTIFTTSDLKNGDLVTCIATPTSTCVAAATSAAVAMTIIIPAAVTVPNTFTPNNDGINDLWQISGLISYTNCTVNIYNRYGSLIYHSTGYSKAWDGTYKGKELPFGTYYYVINLGNTSNKLLKGYVTIVR
jgi:gliding motility-associated-like protein